jgi:hypothetical protein
MVAPLGAVLLTACASTGQLEGETVASISDGCRKVHIAGTRFPKTICDTNQQGLTEMDKEKLREAIGRPIVTEID